MALVRNTGGTRLEQGGLALATLVPLFAYVATASGFGYWLDGGELVAAGVDLDIAHPPGHPLASLVARAFAFLPVGPLPFRVAVGQAVCASIAGAFFFRAVHTTLRALGVDHERVSVPTALGASWIATLCPGFWLQAVRPEVYALEAMLLAIVIERFVTLEARWPTLDVRPLYQAGLVLGLGLSNHHFMAVLLLPALAPTLARVYRARGGRPLSRFGSAVALGLSTYVYLPVRASTSPPIDLGHPTDLASFLWVVSARAYQGSHALSETPFGDRMLDVVLALAENVQVAGLVVALAGSWALLRAPGARRIGWIWLATAAVGALGRGALGFVRGNPDALGYLMPTILAIVALAASFVGALASRLDADDEAPSRARNERRRSEAGRAPRPLALVLATLVVVLGLAQLRASASVANLAGMTATDSFDGPRYRDLPTGAVVIAFGPQTVFRHWSARAVEASRPDVTILPMPFLGYPGMVRSLTEREPALSGTLRGYLIEGELRQPDVQSLAGERPLLVEMDPRVPESLVETVVPTGLLYAVEPAGAADADVARGARVREAILARLYDDLGDQIEEPETRNQLVWLHYMDALFFARVGARDAARVAAERGLALAPEAVELVALRRALEQGRGPLDVTPFLVTTPP
ncbi:MAG: hypothetical protein OHK0013_29330 [Sandaracinaceae bacterium]